MRHWHTNGYGHGHWLGGWGIAIAVIGSLVVLVVLVLAAIALFRYITRSRRPVPYGAPAAGAGPAAPGAGRAGQGWGGAHGSAAGPTPEQVLAERFARGEIDAEEYRHRLDTLRSADGPGGG
ncbi:SHOCT domain-containing protein [Kitasatospora sp. NPDC004745]|uniref:SHOCT domain-containing protein n=1 Tax=Kitasatospora sp. NPDC004745 TaxID=3364019 RepID=UPI00369A456B